MKTKIFITGSAGFIGFHVAKKYLDKGFAVLGLDSMNKYYDVNLKKDRLKILKKHKNFSFVKGNIENIKFLENRVKKFNPSVIIHLAAQAGIRYSVKNPGAYLNSNIIGTFNILEISRTTRTCRYRDRRCLLGNPCCPPQSRSGSVRRAGTTRCTRRHDTTICTYRAIHHRTLAAKSLHGSAP